MQYLIIFFAAYAIVCKNQQIGVIGGWSWWVALIPTIGLMIMLIVSIVLKIKLANKTKKLVDDLAKTLIDK